MRDDSLRMLGATVVAADRILIVFVVTNFGGLLCMCIG